MGQWEMQVRNATPWQHEMMVLVSLDRSCGLAHVGEAWGRYPGIDFWGSAANVAGLSLL